MTDATDFLKGWILANVHPTTGGEAEIHGMAQLLVERFVGAAFKAGIDPSDPAMDPEWLYQQMCNAIDQVNSDIGFRV